MSLLDTILWRSRDTMERHDGSEQVRFEFPLGFQIIATKKGVTFVGTSINYDAGSIQLVEQGIKWATCIYLAMRDSQGIPPQAECEGKLILQIKNGQAWWKGGYKNRVKDNGSVSAASILRRIQREEELKTEQD